MKFLLYSRCLWSGRQRLGYFGFFDQKILVVVIDPNAEAKRVLIIKGFTCSCLYV
jgi:hypothetical protein